MKNIVKMFGIIALVAVMGLSFMSCGEEKVTEITIENRSDFDIDHKYYLASDTANPYYSSSKPIQSGYKGGVTFEKGSEFGKTWIVKVNTVGSSSQIASSSFKLLEGDSVTLVYNGTTLVIKD